MAELVIKTVKGKLFGPLKRRENLSDGSVVQRIFLRSINENYTRDVVQIYSKDIATYKVINFKERVLSVFSKDEIKYFSNHPDSPKAYDIDVYWGNLILSGIEVELLVINSKIIAFGHEGKWLSAKSCSSITDLEKFKKRYISKHLKEKLIDFKMGYEALIPYIEKIWDTEIQDRLNEIKEVFDKGGVDELIERLK